MRSYRGIRNIVVLVLAVSYFAAIYLGDNLGIEEFFVVPSFFNYAVADGIYNLLFPDKVTLHGIKPNSIDDFQLRFEFEEKLGKLQLLKLLINTGRNIITISGYSIIVLVDKIPDCREGS